MKNVRYLADGVTVSNDTRITGYNNNDMIIGSSGSGKTGGYVIPNLQNITGSMVVSDTKGQLCRMFKDELIEKGYSVYVLDFVDPLNSCGYDPLSGIRRYKNGKYREQDVLTLAHTIMPTLDEKDPFWEKSAASYIAFLIAFCLETLEPKEQNMISICKLHQTFSKPNGDLSFIQWVEKHPDTYAAKKYRKISSIGKVDKTWGCIQEFVNIALEPFEFDEARSIFENPDRFDIRSLGHKKTVLFLNVSDTDRTFDYLVNVFHTQTLQLLCSEADLNPDGKLKVPVRIIMDDFAASARIPDFDKVISVIRSREISVSVILQSMTQLESTYSHAEAMTIINNCDHMLYLGSQDIDTANFIAYRLCKTPETVLRMPRNQAILMTIGEKTMVVNKVMPYSTLS